MTKQNAEQFISEMEKDGELKSKYSKILIEYEGKNLSLKEWDRIILEKIIPLAKESGYEFSLENLNELYKPSLEELSDEELVQVSGGRGTYGSYYCDMVQDDQMFEIFYTYGSLAGCSKFQGHNSSDCRSCRFCVNLKRT